MVAKSLAPRSSLECGTIFWPCIRALHTKSRSSHSLGNDPVLFRVRQNSDAEHAGLAPFRRCCSAFFAPLQSMSHIYTGIHPCSICDDLFSLSEHDDPSELLSGLPSRDEKIWLALRVVGRSLFVHPIDFFSCTRAKRTSCPRYASIFSPQYGSVTLLALNGTRSRTICDDYCLTNFRKIHFREGLAQF